MSQPPSSFTVEPADAGKRLDLFVSHRLRLTRNQVKRLLAQGAIRLNNRTTTEKDKGLLLYAGSTVSIQREASSSAEIVVPQPDLPLTILTEAPGWIAVDKPPGLPIHPLEAGETNTLLNAVAARYPDIQGVGEGALRSGVVHRLDIDTSGVVLFALNQPTWESLRSAFEEHRTKKIYRALVQGQLHGAGREQMPLIVAQHHPAKVKVTEPDHPKARLCNLSWRAVEEFDSATLLEIELGTGFLHQIRAMMAELGHPVVGDLLYGRPAALPVPRQMLHASFIRAASAQATSPDPADFVAALTSLR
jgi:23S rRNA pseudouridine1911/1915/1917 synthase